MVGGRGVQINGIPTDYNADGGPSFSAGGIGWADPRWKWGGGTGKPNQMFGWQGVNYVPVLDQAPATASTTIIAAAQAPTAGTALTLRTASTAGATVLSSAFTAYPSQNSIPANAIALDGNPAYMQFGQNQSMVIYDPSTMLARAVTVNWAGADGTTAAYVTVAGYDVYGCAQTEKITGASGTTTNGKKAFKWITSATPGGTLTGSNVSVGTTNIFGFPMRVDEFAFVTPVWNSTLGTSSGFVAADTTSPATSTTGDVRGTYNPGTADGTKALQLFITPNPKNVYLNRSQGLVGVTPA